MKVNLLACSNAFYSSVFSYLEASTIFLFRQKTIVVLFSCLLVSNSLFSQTIGEYRSRTSGNWNAAGATGTWEQWNGSAWVTQYQSGITYSTPVEQGFATGVQNASNVTSHPITLPSGVVTGELLLVIFSVDDAPTVSVGSGSGWTKLGQETAVGYFGLTSYVTSAIFWKIATGSDALTLATSSSERSSHISYRFSNAVSVSGTSARTLGLINTGASANSDPPNHSAPNGSRPYVWVATRSGDDVTVATTSPGSFGTLRTVAAGHSEGVSTNAATRTLTAASLDPGSFTSSSAEWVSYTLAVEGPGVPAYTPIVFPESGFPVVAETNTSSENSATNSHDVALPSGIIAGDMLLVFWTDEDNNTTITTTGWTELYNNVTGNRRRSAYYRIATGAEGAYAVFTTSGNEVSAHNSYRISAGSYHGLPIAAAASAGTNQNPDPPALNPGAGSRNFLWIAASHSEGNATGSQPANYTNLISGYSGSTGSNHARTMTARRNLVATSEDPGTFGLSNNRTWAANTIAIRGSGTATVLNGHTVTTTAAVSVPDVTINSGGQLIINNSVTQTVPAGGTFTVNGTLQMGVNGTALIDGAGTFTLGANGTLGVTSANGITSTACGTGASCGNIRTTTRTFGAARYIYNGNAAQNTGNGLPATINSLTINNGAGVALSQNVAITGSVTFSNGILTSTATQKLTLNDNATASGASATSYVNGWVRKIGNDAFSFPVGNSGLYSPLSISAPDNVADAFDVEYRRQSGTSLGSISSPGLFNVSNCEYWVLNEINDAGSVTTINVTTSWTSNSGCSPADYVTMPSAISLAHFNGSTWDTHGGSGSGTQTAGSVTRTGVSNFSIFTLGNSNQGSNPLPVTISRIKAYEKQTGIQIDWTAYTEINVKHYEIERSADGRTFTPIGQVVSVNSTSTKDYGFFDANPLPGTSFYRLKNVDNDNKTAYSSVVRISLDKTDKGLTLYPNPVSSGYVVFQSADMTKGNYTAKVINAAGQQVQLLNFTHTGGAINQRIQLPATVKSGLYVLQIDRDAEKIVSKRFIVR